MPIILATAFIPRVEAAENFISFEFRDTPLVQVLQQLSAETGINITCDSTFGDYRVSAVLKHVTLDRGLRQILNNLNHATILLPGNKIKVIIIDSRVAPAASSSPAGSSSPHPKPFTMKGSAAKHASSPDEAHLSISRREAAPQVPVSVPLPGPHVNFKDSVQEGEDNLPSYQPSGN